MISKEQEPTPTPNVDSLDSLEHFFEDQARDARALPPIENWNPERVASMDLVIRRDGTWWYQGSQIKRQRMVNLFSTVLRRDNENEWCLVTPAEKLIITVEDAPFVANRLSSTGQGKQTSFRFETNVGDQVVSDRAHPVYLTHDCDGNPSPYVMVRRNLPALIARSVYYQLVDNCIEHAGKIGFWSGGIFHELGPAEG